MSNKKTLYLSTFVCILSVLPAWPTAWGQDKPSSGSLTKVPQWAKRVVWYQIFPERFRNGDTNNDPKLEDERGAWPHDIITEWHVSPWTSDWYALQPWERDGKGFYYHVQCSRYGGDLQGILDKLDYLTGLGINGIYFNPLFESPSLHKYDGATYHHIDDNFGPDPQRDRALIAHEIPDDPGTWVWTTADSLFLKLVEECQKRGIKVIIDGAVNHVGLNFWAFRDLVKYQQKSHFKDWFTVKRWDNPKTPENEFEYGCWFGVKELPEIREDKNGFVPGARKYIFKSVKRWMDPNNDGDPSDGIDGWRLDVAEQVSFTAWRDFRKWVRSINPEAYLVGEVWWEKWPTKMFNAAPWLQGDVFDAVMNYRLANIVQNFFIDKKNKIRAREFDAKLKELREDYPQDVNYVLLNLLDSHDTDRLSSNIVNPDFGYDARVNPKESSQYNVRKPNGNEIKVQKLIVLFQITYIGAPMIYYGDEAGMWGGDDPDDRKPMLWSDLKYDDEISHPFGKKRPRDKNVFNEKLFNHYQKLIHIRRTHPALMLGDFKTLITDNDCDLYAFKRTYKDEKIAVILNNSNQSQELSLNLGGTDWINLLNNEKYQAKNGLVRFTLHRKSGVVIKKER